MASHAPRRLHPQPHHKPGQAACVLLLACRNGSVMPPTSCSGLNPACRRPRSILHSWGTCRQGGAHKRSQHRCDGATMAARLEDAPSSTGHTRLPGDAARVPLHGRRGSQGAADGAPRSSWHPPGPCTCPPCPAPGCRWTAAASRPSGTRPGFCRAAARWPCPKIAQSALGSSSGPCREAESRQQAGRLVRRSPTAVLTAARTGGALHGCAACIHGPLCRLWLAKRAERALLIT